MEELKNMKFGDLIELLATIINTKPTNEVEKKYLSKSEVLEQYPLFTENTLYKAVKFQGLEYIKAGRNKFYDKVPNVVNGYMAKINELAGTDYQPFNYYGGRSAK